MSVEVQGASEHESSSERRASTGDTSLPQVFGRYLLVQRISRGGMGEIFLAKHGLAGFEKLCVIKKVLPNFSADEQFISRFIDEAQVAIKLHHVNIVQVFEVGRVGDEYFLALEYVEGRDVRRTLSLLDSRRQRFPIDLALFIGREVANGLAYAHRRTSNDGSSLALVHCDISPPNVLVSFEGETKIIDFGIAKSAIRATATDPKMGFGKFGYMAPEQLIRGGVVDHRTDIYAAGVVLFELLTGHRLYEVSANPDYRALAKAVSRGDHELPSAFDPQLAPLDGLIARALRPKQDDRYQSAAEFRDAIQAALVGYNPTISTDQLGAFMQGVFAEEMAAQRDLHDRVAQTHLSDFEEQLQTQAVVTISFGQAAPGRPRSTTRPPPPLAPGRTGEVSPVVDDFSRDHAGADNTDAATRLTVAHRADDGYALPPRRRWTWLAVVALAAIVVGAFAVGWLWQRESGETVAVATIAPIDAGRPTIDALKAAVTATAIQEPPDAGVAAEVPAVEHAVTVRPRPPVVAEVEPHHVDPPTTAPTAASLKAKFAAAAREYKVFRAQNGARLESDWTELATSRQYAASASSVKLGELEHQIDAFRTEMHGAH